MFGFRGKSRHNIQLGKISNAPDGFAKLELLISQTQPPEQTVEIQLIIEPTGGYEKNLLHYIHKQDWAKGSGYRAKTDKIDAKMLAHFGTQQPPRVQALLPANAQQLAYLLARQEDLKTTTSRTQSSKSTGLST